MLKNLRAIRQERHMTQQQVANHLGITRQALSNYENGTREPEYDLLCRLAELLRCPVSDPGHGQGRCQPPGGPGIRGL